MKTAVRPAKLYIFTSQAPCQYLLVICHTVVTKHEHSLVARRSQQEGRRLAGQLRAGSHTEHLGSETCWEMVTCGSLDAGGLLSLETQQVSWLLGGNFVTKFLIVSLCLGQSGSPIFFWVVEYEGSFPALFK